MCPIALVLYECIWMWSIHCVFKGRLSWLASRSSFKMRIYVLYWVPCRNKGLLFVFFCAYVADRVKAGCWKVCMSISSLLRLCVCNPGGGELWWRLPVARCHRTKPSHSKVPLLLCALPSLGLWTGHAAGPASFLCCGSGLHCAVSWVGRHHHGDGWCRVSQLPVSGIYPEPVVLFCSPVHMLWTSKCLHLAEQKHSGCNAEVDKRQCLWLCYGVCVCVQMLPLCALPVCSVVQKHDDLQNKLLPLS